MVAMTRKGAIVRMALSIELEELGANCVLRICGDLDGTSVRALQAQVDRLGHLPCNGVVLDLSRLTTMDATGANVLVGLHYYVEARGGQLTVTGAGDRVAAALNETPLGRATR